MTLKAATVAPKGSVYHRAIQETGAAWSRAQGEGARFIIYADGTQGSEASTVRRMRVGQLDAAMLTVVGLMEIEPSIAALQLMPLVFRSWEEFDYVHERLRPELERMFLDKGFVILFWAEGGWVQFFSTERRLSPHDYRPARIFTWAGTPDQVDIMKNLGYQPVVLELADILAALQTGMIDTVPVAPMWALAYQLYGTTGHMLRINWVPIVGAAVVTTRAWERMRPEARDALRNAAAGAQATLRNHRAVQDQTAIAAMQARGLTVHEATPDVRAQWENTVQKAWPLIRGTMVPAPMFDRVQALVAAYRAGQP